MSQALRTAADTKSQTLSKPSISLIPHGSSLLEMSSPVTTPQASALHFTSPRPSSPNWKRHHSWSLCFTSKNGKEGQMLLRKYPLKHLISTVCSPSSHCSLKCNIEKQVLCCSGGLGRKQNCKIFLFTDKIPVKNP